MNADNFRCELSWSVSRAREFYRCRREYWFARYASWGWWRDGAAPESYDVVVHKNLTSLRLFTGTCMHYAIERWFAYRYLNKDVTSEDVFNEARRTFREGWKESTGSAWKSQPNRSIHFDEHHYGIPIGNEELERARDLLQKCSHNFIINPVIESARSSDPESWLALESLDSITYHDIKMYAVPDFAYHQNGSVFVWDWKTGHPNEKDRFQLYTYVIFAVNKWSVNPEEIQLHFAYLADNQIQVEYVDSDFLLHTEEQILKSIDEMSMVHYNPDIDSPNMDHWPPGGAPDWCQQCRFRGICPEASFS